MIIYPTNQKCSKRYRILELLVQGCTNKDIAKELGIAVNTVKQHLLRLFILNQVTTRIALASLYVRYKRDERTRQADIA